MQGLRQKNLKRLLTAAAIVGVVFLVGCDEYVHIVRDHDIRIPKHATWAWRPAEEARNTPPPATAPAREPSAEDDVMRQKVKTAIEQTLASKGFQQTDPAQAEFLVDYKFAVRRQSETVPAYGGYPGLVCGPFRCWYGAYGPAFVGYENIHFRAGMIVFDWTQKDTRHLVYRAVGEKPVDRDAFSLSQDQINGLTHKLLSQLNAGK